MDGVRSQAQRLRVRLEHRVEIQPRSGQGAAHLVQGLAQRAGRGDHRFRPEVGRDRLAGPGSSGQDQQGEERLRVTAHEPDFLPVGGTDREAAEERDLQARWRGGAVSHDVPSKAVTTSGPSPRRAGRRTLIGPPPGSPISFPPSRPVSAQHDRRMSGMVSAAASGRDTARDTRGVGQPTRPARVHCRDRADRRHRVRLRPAPASGRRLRRAMADGRARRRPCRLSRRRGRSRPSRVPARRRPPVHRRSVPCRGRSSVGGSASCSMVPEAFAAGPRQPPGPVDRRARAWVGGGRRNAHRRLRRQPARGARGPMGAHARTATSRGARRRQAGHGARRERPGSPLDAIWATAYLGPGPWGSLGPGASVAPGAALRGDRDARPGDDPDRWRRGQRVARERAAGCC